MKSFKNKLSFCILLLASSAAMKAQIPSYYLLNMDTVTYYGSTDTTDYMPIQVNTTGEIVVSGNQKVSVTQYDATTASQLNNATLAWVNSFNTSTDKCFVVASTHDASGFIYNVGAIRVAGGTTGLDMFTQKLAPTGSVIWTKYYNGPNNTIDVASAVAVDGSGNVYVTGASEGTGSMMDFVTLKYNSSGTPQWSAPARYNYAGSMDIPTQIKLTGGNVFVSGTSGTSFLNYDFATVKYNQSTGSQIGVSRTANPNTAAQDKVCSMAADNQGNLYVVGTTFNGTNYDLQLQKLDTALSVIWTQTYAGYGFDDAGINLALDGNNDIYVVGSSYTSLTSRQLTVVKFSNSGVIRWAKSPCRGLANSSEGLRVKVKNDNLIFVGGNQTSGTNQDLVLLAVDSTGKTLMNKSYDGQSAQTEKFMDLTLDGNDIYVSARSYNGTDDDNIVVKFSYRKCDPVVNAPNSGGLSGYKYDPNDLIIEFHKKALKMTAINDRDKLFGELNDFVSDSTCNKITDALDHDRRLGIDAKHFPVHKIFYTFTEADTVTQSRLGDNIRLHDYYCYLQLTMPSNINNTTAFSAMRVIKPDIKTADYVFFLDIASTTAANDPLYNGNQGGLHPVAGYPDSHVNADSAWTIAEGKSHVRVGIFDTGMNFNHPDLAGMTQQGYDYYYMNNLSPNNNDDSNHGTGDGGLIGAVRNNNLGIAGIAGRDANNPNNTGVTLVDCKVCSYSICPVNTIANGVVSGINAQDLDIMNLSICTSANFYNAYPFSYAGLLVKAMNDANRAGIALVSSKGNFQNNFNGQPQSIATWAFPADYSEEILMSVGSTGRNGHHCVRTINCSNSSAVWGNIDMSAPGTDSLVRTLDTTGLYRMMDGTSIAAPHVSGATALLMSYRNTSTPTWDNMNHEDCEHILERTCFDLVGQFGETASYDTVTGWGRININRALREVNKNYYRFRHITRSVGSVSSARGISSLNSNVNLYYDDFCSPVTTNAAHSTNVYEVTTTLNYVLNPGEVLIDAWPMTKQCFGNKLDTIVHANRPFYSKIISVSNTQAVLKTYFFKYNTTGVYFPFADSSKITSAITLYTYDSTGTVGINKHIENYRTFAVYPNPSAGTYNVVFNADHTAKLTYHVYNIMGQEIKMADYSPQLGINELKLQLSDAPAGVYIFSIFESNKPLHTQKLIKSN